MKKIVCLCIACVMSLGAVAQDVELSEVIAKGNKVFVDFIDERGNIEEKDGPLLDRLKELGYWDVVTSKDDADFILKLPVVKKGSKALLTITLSCTPSILTKDGVVLWTGKSVKGAPPAPVNGYNAYRSWVIRLIHRSFVKELGIPMLEK